MREPRNIIEVRARSHVNWMLYGEPGVGKSRLVGTAPKLLVLANNVDEVVGIDNPDATVIEVADYHDLSDAVEYVRHEGVKKFEWVAFDNATLFQEQGMDQIMAELVAAKPHRDIDRPDKAEYGLNQNRLGRLIRLLIAAPINFVMTAHVMRSLNEQEEDIILPAFQGGQGLFSQKLCGWMNLVTYMEVRRSKGKFVRVLNTANSGRVQSKDRFDKLARREIDLTVPELTAKLELKPQSTRRRRTKKTTSGSK